MNNEKLIWIYNELIVQEGGGHEGGQGGGGGGEFKKVVFQGGENIKDLRTICQMNWEFMNE